MLSDHRPLPELDVLVVAPHPDDAEIGAGGLLARSQAEGLRVGVIDLTSGEPTPYGSPEVRTKEAANATNVLKLTWRANLGLPNRSLEANMDARRLLASVFRRTRPRIVLAPYWEDAHPDHVAACQLAEGARFWSKLSKTDIPGQPFWPPRMLYYFSIHLRVHPKPAFILDISEQIETKMQSIRCYASQFIDGRSTTFPTHLDDIRDRARYWGWAIGKGFAEPFASREDIGLASIQPLV